ncbi:MAG TPA: hypothetical protein VGH60_05180 [Solirubrobacteraceae bacterium]|jgi:hypothetical protein
MAAIFNLNHHATYVHWHFITLSLSNVIVIAVMFVVFFAAILAPFPRHGETGSAS